VGAGCPLGGGGGWGPFKIAERIVSALREKCLCQAKGTGELPTAGKKSAGTTPNKKKAKGAGKAALGGGVVP